MSQAPSVPASGAKQQVLFWGCFIALITTSFAFIARMFLINTWAQEFNLDPAEAGRLAGIGIWPFAVSIIGFSLIIDKIGYKVAMVISFVGYMAWSVMGYSAYAISHGEGVTPEDLNTAYGLLYWGSLILGLSNGTVEAYINPVVATIFNREKTKWLNILHAGWPGGLVIAGIVTIMMDELVEGGVPWSIKVGILAVPAIVFFLMLLPLKFPVQERAAAGVSYREMLGEFGILGAVVVGFLVTLQLMDFFTGVEMFSELNEAGEVVLASWAKYLFIGIGVAIVIGFGAYTRSMGRPLLFFLILIMMPLATTELGTDGWITGIMEGVFEGELHPGWILVYTSLIMMVLRFFAGPIVHALSPLGLLAISAVLAIIGLATLSFTAGAMIFVAATLYGVGKTFFWPTMLGVVAEQTPKGGALTLNAIAGIGMLAVGTLGFPLIGALQADRQIDAVVASEEAQKVPGLVEDGQLTAISDKAIYEIIQYKAVDEAALKAKVAELPAEEAEPTAAAIAKAMSASNQKALLSMAVFPAFMLVCYLGLLAYFKSKGGYKAVHLDAAEDTTHPSHGEATARKPVAATPAPNAAQTPGYDEEQPVVDDEVTADEAYADGVRGPNE